MLISRNEAFYAYSIITEIKEKKMPIQTQYKLIKIKKAIEKERDLYNEQFFLRCESFLEKNEKGQFLINQDGGYKVKDNKMEECNYVINELNKLQVQLPDIFFTIEELEELELSFDQLESLEIFIK